MFRNWKTSLGGIVFSVAQWAASNEQGFTWRGFATALPTLLLGLYAHDPPRKKKPLE